MQLTSTHNMRRLILAFGILPVAIACDVHVHPYTDYLNHSVGRADHSAIAKQIGAPHREVALNEGGDLWTYQYCPPRSGEEDIPTCQDLYLTFDAFGTLTEWHAQKIFMLHALQLSSSAKEDRLCAI